MSDALLNKIKDMHTYTGNKYINNNMVVVNNRIELNKGTSSGINQIY